MPLRITSAPVAGIKKRKSATTRPRASPFANHARRKPNVQPLSPVKSDQACSTSLYSGGQEQLPDAGISYYIPETAPVKNVVEAIRYIGKNTFEDLPARAGMNSTRIAQVLNLRRSLPPLASVAHVHTLLNAPTKVEKEIVDLINAGSVRRLIVPGRGNDAAGLGDCLVLAEDWEHLVRSNSVLDQSVKDRYLQALGQMGNSSAVPAGVFSTQEYTALMGAGLLVSSPSLVKGSSGISSLPIVPSLLASTSASRNDVGDEVRESEGSGQLRLHTAASFLSLPNTGPYLRLLGAGRAHLLSLLKKSSFSESPLYLLRDRWDGAVESDKSFDIARRARGESSGVLPGRTKKWKELYGMSFRWALEEAVGAGLIEIFDTGSVGPGVRCL